MTSERGPGSAPDLAEWKLRPPSIRPGIVARPALVDFLEAQPVPLICVVAPPGYGKTTLLAQWAQHRDGQVGWVSVDKRDNDPVMLLTSIAVALDRLEPIDPGVRGPPHAQRLGPGDGGAPAGVGGLGHDRAGSPGPDHMELLENQECLDAVAELALAVAAGSQIVLASRRPPPLPVALLRARGRVAEVGAAKLAMDRPEARALLEAAGVAPSEAELGDLISFTEIGQRLYLSKHTVKTQAISIYRKLGASSRSEAVQRVQEVGLLAG